MSSNAKIIRRVAAAVFLLAAIVPLSQAQGADDERSECERAVGSEPEPCESGTAAPGGSAILEALGQPAQFGPARLPLAQIREDLGYLQSVADYLSRAAAQSADLDFKAIAESVSEIRKRAGRIRESLDLPAPAKDAGHGEKTAPADSVQLRAALSALSAQISDAVDNPALRGRLLDITGSVKARSELEKIVLLSRRIKTSSETLGKIRQ
ncbi:MAG TPA: hypothetical protein VJ715_03395 [Pyrinomonadaceae bacterium]|nr:hypothetical protein [Pyrinomonadaceae bacterium]